MEFFSHSHPDIPSILDQLNEISRNGIDVDGHHISIEWKGGGDLKFQSEQHGLNGHSSKWPCGHCECHTDNIHLSKEDLEARFGIIRRSINRSCRMQHKWGEEYGLTEELLGQCFYECPGCNKRITADNQHLPQNQTQIKKWPDKHRGHYYGKLPVLPVELWDFIHDLLHALLRSTANMFFFTVSMSLRSEAAAEELCTFMEEEYGVKTDPVFNQGSRAVTKKRLRGWNGEECQSVLKNIREILSRVYPQQDSPQHREMLTVWTAWESLYVVLLIDDVRTEKWEELATLVDHRAKLWHNAVLQVTGPHDVTPFMHEIVVHFGDFIRRVGPLPPFSSEGVEARHQPVKRTGKTRTNRRGVGAAKTAAHNTDIVQTMRRDAVAEHIKQLVPKGKGAKKRGGAENSDALSIRINQLQVPVLVHLEMLDADDAEIILQRMSAPEEPEF